MVGDGGRRGGTRTPQTARRQTSSHPGRWQPSQVSPITSSSWRAEPGHSSQFTPPSPPQELWAGDLEDASPPDRSRTSPKLVICIAWRILRSPCGWGGVQGLFDVLYISVRTCVLCPETARSLAMGPRRRRSSQLPVPRRRGAQHHRHRLRSSSAKFKNIPPPSFCLPAGRPSITTLSSVLLSGQPVCRILCQFSQCAVVPSQPVAGSPDPVRPSAHSSAAALTQTYYTHSRLPTHPTRGCSRSSRTQVPPVKGKPCRYRLIRSNPRQPPPELSLPDRRSQRQTRLCKANRWPEASQLR